MQNSKILKLGRQPIHYSKTLYIISGKERKRKWGKQQEKSKFDCLLGQRDNNQGKESTYYQILLPKNRAQRIDKSENKWKRSMGTPTNHQHGIGMFPALHHFHQLNVILFPPSFFSLYFQTPLSPSLLVNTAWKKNNALFQENFTQVLEAIKTLWLH